MISHIVLFEPKAGLSESEVRDFAQHIRMAMSAVPTVRRAMVGRRVEISPGQDRNFGDATYSFSAVVEFDDSKGLIEYLQHPKHVELGCLFWQHCARTVVLEVESVDATTDEVVGLLVKGQN
jgi:stress responsive alpha/beta barrel protein